MFRSLAASISLSLAATPIAAQGQAWQPTGKWSVDDAEEGCVLSRQFSSGGIGLTFKYRPWLTMPGAKISLSSSDPRFPHRARLVLTLSPGEQAFVFDPLSGWRQDKDPDLTVTSSDAGFDAALAKASGVRILVDGRTIDLATGPVAGGTAALKRCRDNRLKGYGLDPATVVPLPGDGVTAALSPDDYPPDAIRANIQGKALVAMSFAIDGKPVNCRIAESTGNASLDLASCRTGFRLKLDPIEGGQPIRWGLFRVYWTLP